MIGITVLLTFICVVNAHPAPAFTQEDEIVDSILAAEIETSAVECDTGVVRPLSEVDVIVEEDYSQGTGPYNVPILNNGPYWNNGPPAIGSNYDPLRVDPYSTLVRSKRFFLPFGVVQFPAYSIS